MIGGRGTTGQNVMLPSQYVGEDLLGGPTAARHYQHALNARNKRKLQQIEDRLDGTQPVKAGKTLQTILVKPPLKIPEQELLFDGIDDFYYEYVKPDKTLSEVTGDNDWVLHFIPNEVGFHTTNPSWWRLELVSKFQYFLEGKSTMKNFTSFERAVKNTPTVHMKSALNAERYMLEQVQIITGESKHNVNATSPYLTRLSTLIMYMLKLSWNEKKDLELQRFTYNRPGLLCGEQRDRIGAEEAQFLYKEPEAIAPRDRWDAIQSERDFDFDSKTGSSDTPVAVKFICEPLTGPFPMINTPLPGTFNPRVVIKLNKQYRQWLLIKLASDHGFQSDADKAAKDPEVSSKKVNLKWELDFSQIFLRIPYLKQTPLDFQKTEAAYYQSEKDKQYLTEKMPHIVISNAFKNDDNRDGADFTLDRIVDWQNEWPTQFGFCFMTEKNLRGPGLYEKEKLSMETCNIDKIQIKINNVDIFQEGPLDWRNNLKTNKMIWQSQMDYWGKPGNPLRHNSCVQRPQDLPFGQKWAWVCLDPGYNGGNQAIERLDGAVDVIIWGNPTEPIRFIAWTMEPYAYYLTNAAQKEWSGPDKLIKP